MAVRATETVAESYRRRIKEAFPRRSAVSVAGAPSAMLPVTPCGVSIIEMLSSRRLATHRVAHLKRARCCAVAAHRNACDHVTRGRRKIVSHARGGGRARRRHQARQIEHSDFVRAAGGNVRTLLSGAIATPNGSEK